VIKLSPREQQVLCLYLTVGRLKPIAESLGVSLHTVKAQKGHVMRKLGASNTVELMHAAIQRGLIDRRKAETK
jgi:DNA-binding CsgD family transcriptional regulator